MRTIYKNIIAFFFLLLFMHSVNAQEYWHRVKGGLGHVGSGESVNALLSSTIDNKLYASGTFSVMDDTIGCAGIAIWNDTTWTSNIPLVGSINLYALAIFQGKLFDAGLNGVGYFDTVWHTAGIMNTNVYCMCVYHNKLYVGGDFTNVNGIQATFIACYDGTSWSEPGGGIWCTQFPGDVKSMCVWNDKLIVGGAFDQAGGVSVHSVAAWNDTAWSDVGGGVIYTNAPTLVAMVFSLVVYENNLIVGGRLDKTGDNTMVNHICEFNGVSWSALGTGTSADVDVVYGWDSILYVGGGFLSAGGIPNTHYIAQWNGTQWSNVGTGLEGNPKTFCVYDSILYVGGYGFTIDGYEAAGIVRLMDYPDTSLHNDTTLINEIAKDTNQLIVSPNPFSETLNLKNDFQIGDVVEIRNLLGIKVFEQKITSAVNTISVNSKNFQQGIYLCMLRKKNGAYRIVKVIKQ